MLLRYVALSSAGLHGPWTRSSTAFDRTPERDVFRVTHEFHPLLGQEFELLEIRQCWGEERVIYLGEDGNVRFMPLEWTNALGEDPFSKAAAGCSKLRTDTLLELADLVGKANRNECGC